MAKRPTFAPLAAVNSHYARTARYLAAVRRLYDLVSQKAATLLESTGYDPAGGVPFVFSDWPEATHGAQQIRKFFANNLQAIIMQGTSEEWAQSNLMSDLLAEEAMKVYKVKNGRKTRKHWFQDHAPALEAFQQRKVNGMNLSQRIWNHSADAMSGLEAALSAGIEKGMSAVTLSNRVSKYLNDFEALRKDYKEQYGTAKDIKDCEYRSARLARTEINMAYRTAEQMRWQDMDFVLGYEVCRSGGLDRENDKLKPYACDLCESLAGKYPKNFDFKGWHPNCRCYTVPILKSDEEFWAHEGDTPSPNEITDVPDNFKAWVQRNQDALADMEKNGKSPLFVRDNKGIVARIYLGAQHQSPSSVNPIENFKSDSLLGKSRSRHAARTDEQIQGIEQRAKARAERQRKIVKGANYAITEGANYPQDIAPIVLQQLRQGLSDNNLTLVRDLSKNVNDQLDNITAFLSSIQNDYGGAIIPDAKELLKLYNLTDLSNAHKIAVHKLKELIGFSGEGVRRYGAMLRQKGGSYELPGFIVERRGELQRIEMLRAKSVSKGQKIYLDKAREMLNNTKYDTAGVKKLLDSVSARRPKELTFSELTPKEVEKLYKEFLEMTPKKIDEMWRRKTELLWEILTDKEKNEITAYTECEYLFNKYKRFGYTNLKFMKPRCDVVDTVLSLNELEAPRFFRRGIDDFDISTTNGIGRKLSELNVGESFIEKGYLSTGCASDSGFNRSIELIICAPQGAQGVYTEPFSAFNGAVKYSAEGGIIWNGEENCKLGREVEWLGNSGVELKVLKKDIGNGMLRMFMQIVGQRK